MLEIGLENLYVLDCNTSLKRLVEASVCLKKLLKTGLYSILFLGDKVQLLNLNLFCADSHKGYMVQGVTSRLNLSMTRDQGHNVVSLVLMSPESLH